MIPGEYLLENDPIEINAGRAAATIAVTNTGDRPIQVGSHCHFFEVNRALVFDRPTAYGMRLDIAAGTATRFEPGDSREVTLVAIGGRRQMIGINNIVNGELDDEATRRRALDRMAALAKGTR
jgi:urease subunit beta